MGAGTMNRPGPADHAAATAVNGGTASYERVLPAVVRSSAECGRCSTVAVYAERRCRTDDGVTVLATA